MLSARLRIQKSLISGALIASMFAPGIAAAADPSGIVDTALRRVTRGQFLEWTIKSFDLYKKQECNLPKKDRVPARFVSSVCVAAYKGALKAFNSNARIMRSITVGEALKVITILTGKKDEAVVSFTDIEKGTDMEIAVKNAIANKWMIPASKTNFGVDAYPTGAQVLSLLQAVTNTSPVKPQQIKINLLQKPPTVTENLPSEDLILTVWQIIQRDFVRSADMNKKEAGYKMIEGLVQSLGDPYSTFFRPTNADQFNTMIKGEVTGIGAHVEMQNGILTIIAPLPKSPAEQAGLKSGDQILEADGNVLQGLDVDKAVSFIRGEKGTDIVLKVRRNSDEFTVRITRSLVTVPEIEISWDGDIAIVKLVQFGETTNTRFRALMEEIAQKNPRGIVLDLRNNPGGLLQAADMVVSNFVPKGSVVAQVKGRMESSNEITNADPTVSSSAKVVVLVNEGSASASEIVAGALQDYKRATIVGTKTFGKGTVQEILNFSGGEALKLTIAEWLTPNGRHIDKIGVIPDIVFTDKEPDMQLKRAIGLARE